MCSRSARGFTLIEIIVVMVVVSVALAGILLAYSNAVQGSPNPNAAKQALAAAEAMLEEVQLAAFCNPSGGFGGPYTQANRQNFDDVDDYAGFATTGIYTIDGVAPVTGLEAYNVSVAVAAADFPSAAVPTITAASGDAKRITVTVTGPTNLPNAATVVLSGYRFDIAGNCP